VFNEAAQVEVGVPIHHESVQKNLLKTVAGASFTAPRTVPNGLSRVQLFCALLGLGCEVHICITRKAAGGFAIGSSLTTYNTSYNLQLSLDSVRSRK